MSKGESEELNPPELTIRNSNCFPASILQDTSENTMGSNASSSSNGSTTNNTSNIKIENTNSYYCNSYSNPLQNPPPVISAIAGSYSEYRKCFCVDLLYKSFLLSVDANSGFSVILRPGDQLNSNPGHDALAIQRYATHPATRLVSVGQSRQDEVLLHQQQQHSALTQQAVSPGSVFYQHSPSASDVNAGDNHNQNQESDGGGASSGSTSKYSECQTNGHDTLSDFVTFVCQESEQGQSQNHRNSPKSQQYPQYNTMLPPPPLPPMARPVAIIRSSDLTMVNSPPTSITPPTTMSSPHQEHQDSHMGQNDANHSPPLSPQSHMDRKGLTRIASPYSNGRDYTFNHFHSQQTQVSDENFSR